LIDSLCLLWSVQIPTLIVQSLQDEYIPQFVDIPKLTHRMQNAIGPHCRILFLEVSDKTAENLQKTHNIIETTEINTTTINKNKNIY
jgi:hypothetical protein